MSNWTLTQPHHCPKCPPFINKRKMRIDAPLELVRENYSGLSVDIAHCPTCNRNFQVSYQVEAEIMEIDAEGREVK